MIAGTPIGARDTTSLSTTPVAARRAGCQARFVQYLLDTGAIAPTDRLPGRRGGALWSEADIERLRLLIAARSLLPIAWGAEPLSELWAACATEHASITIYHSDEAWRWAPTSEVLPGVGIVVDLEGLRLDADR